MVSEFLKDNNDLLPLVTEMADIAVWEYDFIAGHMQRRDIRSWPQASLDLQLCGRLFIYQVCREVPIAAYGYLDGIDLRNSERAYRRI